MASSSNSILGRTLDFSTDCSPPGPPGSSIATQAELAIILRLMDGISLQYLRLASSNLRAEVKPGVKKDPRFKLWCNAVDVMLKDEETVSSVMLKAAFYRELWNSPETERTGTERREWLTQHLFQHAMEQLNRVLRGESGGFPVPKALGQQYSAFERRQVEDDKIRKAVEQRYFESAQPEAAELLRKQAADKMAEDAGLAQIKASLAAELEGAHLGFFL